MRAAMRAAARAGQRRARQIMLDTCLIERSTGRVRDPETLEYVDTWETVYAGPARFKPSDTVGVQVVAGEQEFTQAALGVQLPISAPIPPHGARVTWTAVDPVTGDPAQVGRVFWTGRTDARSQATKREVTLTEVRPGG